MVRIIAAHDANRVIGINNDLPWRIPADLQRFKALTTGGAVIMGRKTWDSLPRKPLPGRDNLVVTRQQGLSLAGARCFTDLREALAAAPQAWVIGGGEIYRDALPSAQELWLTVVEHAVIVPAGQSAVYFPSYESEFVCQEREAVLATSEAPAYRFERWSRRNGPAPQDL